MQQDDPQNPPFDAVDLQNFVKLKIRAAVLEYFQIKGQPRDVSANDVADDQEQSYALGEYIVNQNPYSFPFQLDLPKIPTDPQVETRRIRKTGVLRHQHAYSPPANPQLPSNEAIPGGFVFEFVYPDLLSLNDVETDLGDPDPDADTSNDLLNKKKVYQHNIVKIVRFRYSLLNRTMPVGGQQHPSPAYLLVMYSGADG
jgi:hypothetical protein